MRCARLLATGVLTLVIAVAGQFATASAHATGKPHREFVYAKIIKLEDGSLSFRARVADYPDGYVALMKKTCRTCTWSRVAIRRTTDFGRVFMPVPAPSQGRWYWRYRTPQTADFAVSYSATWYTFRD